MVRVGRRRRLGRIKKSSVGQTSLVKLSFAMATRRPTWMTDRPYLEGEGVGWGCCRKPVAVLLVNPAVCLLESTF